VAGGGDGNNKASESLDGNREKKFMPLEILGYLLDKPN